MTVCPYRTARYRRGCTITMRHWHYRDWDWLVEDRTMRVRPIDHMLGVWWPQRQPR